MSSSHLFFGLPIVLLVQNFELSSEQVTAKYWGLVEHIEEVVSQKIP